MDCGIRLHHIIHLTGSLNKYNVNNRLAKNILTVSQSANLTVSQCQNLTVLQYQNLSHTISKYNITVNISIFRITILQYSIVIVCMNACRQTAKIMTDGRFGVGIESLRQLYYLVIASPPSLAGG